MQDTGVPTSRRRFVVVVVVVARAMVWFGLA